MRHGPFRRFRRVSAALAASLALLAAPGAKAQSLLRDAEIEHALGMVAAPVLQSSGLGRGAVRFLVVGDRSLNAFVGDQQHIFLHSGLILKLDSPDELQGVMAHELAHITNGHVARRMTNLRSASQAARLGLVLALAAAVAGGADAGVGVAAGTQSAAMRRFFAHTRAEETAADLTAARTMAGAGIDPEAMLRVLEIFRGQEALSSSLQDPYVLTHPLTRDRIRAIKGQAAALGDRARPAPAETRYWYARATTKLSAFLRNPSWTLRRFDRADRGEIATLARAIAYHRMPKPDEAIRHADGLIRARPNDPYYHELKGQILLESGRAGPAITSYSRAARLAPNEPLILAGLGRAQLAGGQARAALESLTRARARDPHDPVMLRDLAVAYARTGDNGMASVATAERYAVMGRLEDAAIHAKRASGLVPRGSPGWLRAQDVLGAAKQAARK
ncbi:peptidase M48 [Maritimibacter sp. 55A14]|uniref:M48 family metalloprotease n=1 Tax=Maritimibacter sp. 55A14 TaxID=2174844 RepID=UPI000D61D5AB|nr:M48 family metalloprotease [Maritimibacter sp. 55A14]PWE30457.1 peptidase M48 [Maritimibacter sp. 55A14]